MEEMFDRLEFSLLQAKLWVYKYQSLAKVLGLKTTDYDQLDQILKDLNTLRLDWYQDLNLATEITLPKLDLIAPYYRIKYPSYLTLDFQVYNDELIATYPLQAERAYESLLQTLSKSLPIPLMLEPINTTFLPRLLGQNKLGYIYLTRTTTKAHTITIFTDKTRQWLVKEIVLTLDDCMDLDVEVCGNYLVAYQVTNTCAPILYLAKFRVHDIINNINYSTNINLAVIGWKSFEFAIEADVLMVFYFDNIYQYNYKTNTEVAKIKLDTGIDALARNQNNRPSLAVINQTVCVIQGYHCWCYNFNGEMLFNDKVEFNRIFSTKQGLILVDIMNNLA